MGGQHPETGECWDVDEQHLGSMVEVTGTTIPLEMKAKSRNWHESLDEQGIVFSKFSRTLPDTLACCAGRKLFAFCFVRTSVHARGMHPSL